MSNVLNVKEKFEKSFSELEKSFYHSAQEIDKQIMEIESKARVHYLTLVSELFDDERIKSDEKIFVKKRDDKLLLVNLLNTLRQVGLDFNEREYGGGYLLSPITIVTVDGLLEVHYEGNYVLFVVPKESFRFSEQEF